ncbi:hypothetical protein NADFUDRAFT_49437 [Nadsonia fulvescens var. elongata DSM 6958]|uniref:F-box domain-containing protein n=1 Tax=Nadsonia fulvescens var. elongata DSM 6958 TaxID=857566 RepID=A0A1E3PNI9_9ASCO|nr:hypothetical protein NADFUDRAFT_49437 [Nadsonia fulvescens var. elongata DSM 6958]
MSQFNGHSNDNRNHDKSLKQVSRVAGRGIPRVILQQVVKYLPIPDLLRLAQVSKKCCDVVNVDELWVQKLRNMGIWSDDDARKMLKITTQEDDIQSNGRQAEREILFNSNFSIEDNDTDDEWDDFKQAPIEKNKVTEIKEPTLISFSDNADLNSIPPENKEMHINSQEKKKEKLLSSFNNPKALLKESSPLEVISQFKSEYGHARREFMKIFRNLAPFYYDLVDLIDLGQALIFRYFHEPEEQAQILKSLSIFSSADDIDVNHLEYKAKVSTTIEMFESAALQELELGLENKDYMGGVKRYVNVLISLDGAKSCIDLFTQKYLLENDYHLDPQGFFSEQGHFNSADFDSFLSAFASSIGEQSEILDNVFPPKVQAKITFIEEVFNEVIADLVSSIFEVAKERNIVSYLNTFPRTYIALLKFIDNLQTKSAQDKCYNTTLGSIVDQFYEFSIDIYLEQELSIFKAYAKDEVRSFNQQTAQQETATEKLYLSNITKESDKVDFLGSFKRVFAKPFSNSSKSEINTGLSSPSISSTSTPQLRPATTSGSTTSLSLSVLPETGTGRIGTPRGGFMTDMNNITNLPTTEFEAQAVIMMKKLEGINTLFSLELALNLIKAARNSIERIKIFLRVKGQIGLEAKEHCETIFVSLVNILGGDHVKVGFEKALQRLKEYHINKTRLTELDGVNLGELNPKNGKINHAPTLTLEPLAIFAELVNIGDLIQQMLHVFFEEELTSRKLVDRNDFLSSAVNCKRKFEQMLDEGVADGLSRGIDVLMEQIDFMFITVQLSSDYNPLPQSLRIAQPSSPSLSGLKNRIGAPTNNVGPTQVAKKVVELLSVHMRLLVGSTEKATLDVFQQELGVRFFASICKHLKTLTMSVAGSITLISDLNYYYNFISGLKQKPLTPYFGGLKALGQIYLIDGKDSKALGVLLSDMSRFGGIFQPEEIYEFVQRREDWPRVRREVERVMYGFADCVIV